MKSSFPPLAVFIMYAISLFISNIAKADRPLWLRCTADNESEEQVHLMFSNMMIGSVSMSGRAFINSLVAWDGSVDLDAAKYDMIHFNSGFRFGCESRFESRILQSVRCADENDSDLDIRANYAQGINPSSSIISKVYGKLAFDLERQQGNDRYVVKVTVGSGSREQDTFTFKQILANLQCQSSEDN
ncbi:MAG: hypothetical protein NTV34_14870 [Proteobacteria bacterium]|nr:hypothetical protein [Pseudomonadota bacterium]